MHYRVIVPSTAPALRDGLTYACDETIEPGTLVEISLRGTLHPGIVIGLDDRSFDASVKIKSISKILGTLLNPAHIQTAQWIADHYYCDLRSAIDPFLPEDDWSKLLPKARILFSLIGNPEPKSKVQKHIVSILRERGPLPFQLLREMTGAASATVKLLIKKGWISEISEIATEQTIPKITHPNVSTASQTLIDQISASESHSLLVSTKDENVFSVMISQAVNVLNGGKQFLVIVPDVLTLEHSERILKNALGNDLVRTMHGGSNATEKRDVWRSAIEGNPLLYLGTRSMLFAPLSNLGGIILCNEEDTSYKNEQHPRYHARDVAIHLAKVAATPLLLTAIVPSLEMFVAIQERKISMIEDSSTLRTPRIVDLSSTEFGSNYPLSPPLLDGIRASVSQNRQAVLLLNRRGSGSGLLCLDCKRRIISAHSNLPYRVMENASGGRILIDPLSRQEISVPDLCPYCNSTRLKEVGAGTQKLEALLEGIFGKEKVLRIDGETIDTPGKRLQAQQDITDGKTQIVIGTTALLSGYRFPHAQIAAVILADSLLSESSIRSGEEAVRTIRTFMARTQEHGTCETILQTFRPQSPEILASSNGNIWSFLEQEWKMRKSFGYPPALEMADLIFTDDDRKSKAQAIVKKLIDRKIQASVRDTMIHRKPASIVTVRSAQIRNILPSLALENARVDIDPVD